MLNNKSIEAQFDQEMLKLYWKTGYAIRYWSNRGLQQVRREGGLKVAKSWLRPRSMLNPPKGLVRLVKAKRLDLSVEHLVLQEPYRQLFTNDELRTAEERLVFLEEYGPDLFSKKK